MVYLSNFSTIILADGLFPTHPLELLYLKNAQQVVCCDGAAIKLLKSNIRKPDWIVGDLDSISSNIQAEFKDKIVIDSEQETNDLTKAFHFCLKKGWDKICFLGITGLSDDHNLANLFLLFDYAAKAKVIAPTGFGLFTVVEGDAELSSFVGQQVSFFCSDASTRVDCANLKWPLVNKNFEKIWAGSLNESISETLKLKASDGQVLVFQKYEYKL